MLLVYEHGYPKQQIEVRHITPCLLLYHPVEKQVKQINNGLLHRKLFDRI